MSREGITAALGTRAAVTRASRSPPRAAQITRASATLTALCRA